MAKSIAVIDYGIGNVFSVCNALKNMGVDPVLTSNSSQIRAADYVILPGVGAFARAMDSLTSSGIDEIVRRHVETEKPFLGICIGMQVLMDNSMEFGANKGLGLIGGSVNRINDIASDGEKLLVPHIAWAKVTPNKGISAFKHIEETPKHLYFVHSYHCVPNDSAHIVATADYGGNNITAAIKKDNILGVQFHPERSAFAGAQFLKGFLDL